MKDDIKCPRCQKTFEHWVESEDAKEGLEDEAHCPNCEKVIKFRLEIYPSFDIID